MRVRNREALQQRGEKVKVDRLLTPTIGIELDIPDVNHADDEVIWTIRRHLARHKVVSIRAQQLTEDQFLAFSRRLGSLVRLPYIRPMQDFPEIIAVLKEEDEVDMGVFGGDWHSDFSFLECPPEISILYSREIPACGGDTVWANMTAACLALPDDLKAFLTGRKAVHVGAPYGVRYAPEPQSRFEGSIRMDRHNPEADAEQAHPAVCRHPERGNEPVLFVNPTYTIRFEGMDEVQSRPILERLYGHATRPEFCCRLNWLPDTIVLWDNRSTIHYAVNDYDGFRRMMWRTTVCSSRPLPAMP